MWPLSQLGLAAEVVGFGPELSSLLTGLVVLLWLTAGMIVAVALQDVLMLRRRPRAVPAPVEEDRAAA